MSIISSSSLEDFAQKRIQSPSSLTCRQGSIDLRIGNIYIPQDISAIEKILAKLKKSHDIHAKKEISLKQGQTAVIQTMEELRMPDNIAGLVFPTNRMSMKGLLVTNAGFIDPNYHGHLHITVINMSRHPFSLREGDKILRSVYFYTTPFPTSKSQPINGQKVDEELLERLSPDFLDITHRATTTARELVKNSELRSKWFVPIITSVIAFAGSAALIYQQTNQASYKELKDRIERLESTTLKKQQ